LFAADCGQWRQCFLDRGLDGLAVEWRLEMLMKEGIATDPSRTIRRFKSHKEQEVETIRYWAGRSAAEKMTAVTELAEYAYRMRGIDVHAPRPKGPVVRVQLGGR
jgi:hypothetical protein